MRQYPKRLVCLDDGTVQVAWECGNGNVSAGIRFLALQYKKAQARMLDDMRIQDERKDWQLDDSVCASRKQNTEHMKGLRKMKIV